MRHEESMSLNLELYSLKIIKVAAEEYSKFCHSPAAEQFAPFVHTIFRLI